MLEQTSHTVKLNLLSHYTLGLLRVFVFMGELLGIKSRTLSESRKFNFRGQMAHCFMRGYHPRAMIL